LARGKPIFHFFNLYALFAFALLNRSASAYHRCERVHLWSMDGKKLPSACAKSNFVLPLAFDVRKWFFLLRLSTNGH